jgi:hypothetical protein
VPHTEHNLYTVESQHLSVETFNFLNTECSLSPGPSEWGKR